MRDSGERNEYDEMGILEGFFISFRGEIKIPAPLETRFDSNQRDKMVTVISILLTIKKSIASIGIGRICLIVPNIHESMVRFTHSRVNPHPICAY